MDKDEISITMVPVRRSVQLIPFSSEDVDSSVIAFHSILAAHAANEEGAQQIFKDIFAIVSHDLSLGKVYWGEGGQEKMVSLLKFEKQEDADFAQERVVRALRDNGKLTELEVMAVFKLCAISVYYCLWTNGEITYTCSEPTGNSH